MTTGMGDLDFSPIFASMAYINAEDCDRQEHAVILIGERESFQLWA
jgi:hypothetical protein